jgi:hypothetical protein
MMTQHIDTQHKNQLNDTFSKMTFSIMAECCCDEFHYAECHK